MKKHFYKGSSLIKGQRVFISPFEGCHNENQRELVKKANELLRDYAKNRKKQRKSQAPNPSYTQT